MLAKIQSNLGAAYIDRISGARAENIEAAISFYGECSHVVRSGARDAAEVLAALGYMLCHVIERFGR
jgi:hypothetical protein